MHRVDGKQGYCVRPGISGGNFFFAANVHALTAITRFIMEAHLKLRVMISLLLTGLLAAGCQRAAAGVTPMLLETQIAQPTATVAPNPTLPDRMEDGMTKQPERVPPTESMPPVTGEVPSGLMGSMLQDLSQRTGADPQLVSVIRAQAVVWRDGALGCPQPGVVYTQALVHGYWVTLEFEGKTYDYHAAQNGYFMLCENRLPPLGTPGIPDK